MSKNSALAEKSNSSNQVNEQAARNLVGARIIEIRKGEGTTREQIEKQMARPSDAPGRSAASPDDPLSSLMSEGRLLEPPFDTLTLATLPEHNSEMGQVIEAMETNIEGFGHRFLPRLTEMATDEMKKASALERTQLTNFFAYASMDISFKEMRKRRRKDMETTGNSYWEIIRSVNGKIQGFTHIPSYQVRLSSLDQEQIEVEQPILELQEDASVEIAKIKRWRRFRKFAQSHSIFRSGTWSPSGSRIRWFKEFGDPRPMDNRTGEFLDAEAASKINPLHLANEMEHFKIYSSRSPYGIPRYIGNLLSIFGARAAEEINYSTFKNNNIPSMVISVSNGQLTEGSVARIESFIESQISQSSNWSKFLILEAEGLIEGEDGGQMKIEIQPLTKEQHSDSLFQIYEKNAADKIRRAWRLPPIFVGAASDYTRSAAETSRRLADEQVFAPERDDFDEWMNLKVFPFMGIRYNKFKSNSPNTTDNTELVKILGGSEKTGGMTPRIARDMLEDILGKELPPFSEKEGFDPDIPFSLSMAEAVKNMADPAEPGQQVTALKTAAVASGVYQGSELLDVLLSTREDLQKRWAEGVEEQSEPEPDEG